MQDVVTDDNHYVRYVEHSIIIKKDNAKTMTEITTVYPPLKKGAKFIRIKSVKNSELAIPSNSTDNYNDNAIIYIEDYNPNKAKR